MTRFSDVKQYVCCRRLRHVVADCEGFQDTKEKKYGKRGSNGEKYCSRRKPCAPLSAFRFFVFWQIFDVPGQRFWGLII